MCSVRASRPDTNPKATRPVCPPPGERSVPQLVLPPVPRLTQRDSHRCAVEQPSQAPAGGTRSGVLAPADLSQQPVRAAVVAPASARVEDAAPERLARAWRLKLVVCQVEATLALLAGSALLAADALHLAVDLTAFGFAWVAATYRHRRAAPAVEHVSPLERCAAVINAIVLLLAAWHVVDHALDALTGHHHHEVNFMIALLAAGVRLAASWRALSIMQNGDLRNPNERAIELHCLMDVYISAGMICALLVAAVTGSDAIDPLVSIAIGVLMVRSAYRILRLSQRAGSRPIWD